MSFDPECSIPPGAKIKVFGMGGGGGNAVNTMIRSGLEGVNFVTGNTDIQALRFSLTEDKIQIGKELTKGLGAGADPDVGRDAALEDRHEIQEAIGDADMVFVTAGMGGGTGTGGAPIVAQIAREMGALTVGVVTKPFDFEGKRRRKHAEEGIKRLREHVDTLIIIPNQRLLQIATPDLGMLDAFKLADNILVNAVRGISDIINIPGVVNVDFADVKAVMSCMGMALMGIGSASGEGRATAAARQAISSPLLEDIDIQGATGILINITSGSNLTLMEVNEACSIIEESAHEDANIIFGSVINEECGDEIHVTVIATGFPSDHELNKAPVRRTPTYAQPARPSNPMDTTPTLQEPAPVASAPATAAAPVAPVFESQPVVPQYETPAQVVTPQPQTIEEPAPARASAPVVQPNIEQEPEAAVSSADVNHIFSEMDQEQPSLDLPDFTETEHSSETAEKIIGASADPKADLESSDAEKLADKLKNDIDMEIEDQLDVPTFLRNGMKDLNL